MGRLALWERVRADAEESRSLLAISAALTPGPCPACGREEIFFKLALSMPFIVTDPLAEATKKRVLFATRPGEPLEGRKVF
jgi:hypothetical protein